MNKYVYMVYYMGSNGMASLKHFSNKAKADSYANELKATIDQNKGYVNVNKMILF